MGLPVAPITLNEALDEIDRLIESRNASFLVTANLNYAMLAADDANVQAATAKAALVLADGAPLTWAARREGTPLPERVTGSDLIPALCGRAAKKRYRIFLLGGQPRTAQQAARNIRRDYPGLQLVGVTSPIIHADAPLDLDLLAQIRDARPDLMFVSLSQPKGELWLARHYRRLGVPVSIQVGATFDFLAKTVRRAPRWMQRCGLEWAFRLHQEPRRLARRYLQNGTFLARTLIRELLWNETSLGALAWPSERR